jgi:hypothetical protein
MPLWISKPIYESLPYFYQTVGGISLAAAMYVNHGYWPAICITMGLFCLVAGLVVLLKRRDARRNGRTAQTRNQA